MKLYIILTYFCLFTVSALAQDTLQTSKPVAIHDSVVVSNFDFLMKKAIELQKNYDFDSAVFYYDKLLQAKSITKQHVNNIYFNISVCKNAKKLANYSFMPTIVGKKNVDKEMAPMYFDSLQNGYFAQRTPSMIMDADKEKTKTLPLVFFPNLANQNKSETIYFSSYGKYGDTGLDIYKITRTDGNNWSEPQKLDNTINTPNDEIFSYISQDGKTLYFASNGHYGMGGFDFLKSEFDKTTGKWKQAENLGFPINSTSDELMYIPDNKNAYACFTSTRNCETGKVNVYKIKIERNPDYKEISNIDTIREMAILNINVEKKENNANRIKVNVKGLENNADYIKMLKAAANYNKNFDEIQHTLDNLREKMNETPDTLRENLEKEIVEKENELFEMQTTLSNLSLAISKSEYEFITKGIQPKITDSTLLAAIDENKINSKTKNKKQIKINFGNQTEQNIRQSPNVIMKEPSISEQDMFNFTCFGRMIIDYDYPVPDGIIYKIRVGTFPIEKNLDPETFRNCSPVTADEARNMKRYYIGMFRTHNEAEKALVQLKAVGFTAPIIVAWKNGTIIPIQKAKKLETEKQNNIKPTNTKKNKIYRIIVTNVDDNPELIKTISSIVRDKDISKKSSTDSSILYSIGNFYTYQSALEIKEKLNVSGIKNTEIHEIE